MISNSAPARNSAPIGSGASHYNEWHYSNWSSFEWLRPPSARSRESQDLRCGDVRSARHTEARGCAKWLMFCAREWLDVSTECCGSTTDGTIAIYNLRRVNCQPRTASCSIRSRSKRCVRSKATNDNYTNMVYLDETDQIVVSLAVYSRAFVQITDSICDLFVGVVGPFIARQP